MKPYPLEALDRILVRTADIWPRWRARRLLITGAAGFLGTWLAQAVIHANRHAQAEVRLVAVVRDADRARHERPWLAQGAQIVAADLAHSPPDSEPADLVIHAAALVPHGTRRELPEAEVIGATVRGTRNLLEFAARAPAVRVLFTSSGAVYGAQDGARGPIEESRWLPGATTHASDSAPADAYGRAKREAEALLAHAGARGMQISIARIFALIGPGLALDGRYAAGNFIGDALAGRAVTVASDGRALRSWLDAADACVWLLRMLADAPPGFIANLGSDDARPVGALARLIADAGGVGVRLVPPEANDGASPPASYLPDVRRASETLALRTWTTLEQSVACALAWHREMAA